MKTRGARRKLPWKSSFQHTVLWLNPSGLVAHKYLVCSHSHPVHFFPLFLPIFTASVSRSATCYDILTYRSRRCLDHQPSTLRASILHRYQDAIRRAFHRCAGSRFRGHRRPGCRPGSRGRRSPAHHRPADDLLQQHLRRCHRPLQWLFRAEHPHAQGMVRCSFSHCSASPPSADSQFIRS
jgi:hypothetical protein